MPTSNNIEKLVLNKVSINGIDVQKDHINTIEIYESLQQPGITGKIEIRDYQGIQQFGNIVAGDPINLSFSVQDKENSALENTFTLCANEGNKVIPGAMYDVTSFEFCSPWLIPALSKKISKNWNNKYIHEIVAELITLCGGKPGYIEPTKQKLEIFVSPLWSPYHIIKHLLSYAMNENDLGGYLCWTDLRTGKVNVTTIDYLTKGTLGLFTTFMVYPANQRYEGKMEHATFETQFDVVRQMNAGINHSRIGFSFDTGKHIVIEDKGSAEKFTHLSQYFPIPTSYSDDKEYLFPKFTPLYPQASAAITDESRLNDFINGNAVNEHTFLFADVLKLNIIAPGEPKRRVGWLATVDYPSVNINADDSTGYLQLKGNYLIRDIKHTFSFVVEYQQAITLCADGYKQSTRNLMKWNG